jgi:hypothetical protein
MATATPPKPANLPALAIPQGGALVAKRFSFQEIQVMAEQVAKSGLFPNVTTPAAAFAVMMLCDADGLHPMDAMRRYHIIENKPSMRADAIQAEFQKRGGSIEWHQTDDKVAEATFKHPKHAPKGLRLKVTFEEFDRRGVTKGKEGIKKNWRQSPGSMLCARLVSRGVRLVDPSVIVGVYTPEEVQDFDDDTETEVETPDATRHTGHGSGKYMPDADRRRCEERIRELFDEQNAAWLDRWTDTETNQVAEGITDLCAFGDLTSHLLAFCRRSGRLPRSADPEKCPYEKLWGFLSVPFVREQGVLEASAIEFLQAAASSQEERWRSEHVQEVAQPETHSLPTDWVPFADAALGRFAASVAETCQKHGVPFDRETVPVFEQLVNVVCTSAVEAARIDGNKILKPASAGNAPARDLTLARKAVAWLYRQDSAWVAEQAEAYLTRKRTEALGKLGIDESDAGDADYGQSDAGDPDDIHRTEGGRS